MAGLRLVSTSAGLFAGCDTGYPVRPDRREEAAVGGGQARRFPSAPHAAVLRLAVLCLVVALCAGCAGASRTDGDYRLKAQQTAKALTAVVGSAQLAAQQYLEGRLPQAYADYVISRAEQDGSSIQTAFDSRQPPDSDADHLRSEVDQPLQQITGDLTDLRVALRVDDHARLRDTLRALADPLRALGALQGAS
jgi:hypothetical protein